MSALRIVILCSILALVSFFGIFYFIEKSPQTVSTSGPASRPETLFVAAKTAFLPGDANVRLTPIADGIEIRSTFDTSTWQSTATGGAYYHLDPKAKAQVSGRPLVIELTVSSADGNNSPAMLAQYVLNGLAQSGWQKLALNGGRQVVSFNFAPPPDTRPSTGLDSLWVRSDAAGQGRAVTIHEVRIRPQ